MRGRGGFKVSNLDSCREHLGRMQCSAAMVVTTNIFETSSETLRRKVILKQHLPAYRVFLTACREMDVAYASIARFIDKDHTTVMSAVLSASEDETMIGRCVAQKTIDAM